MLCKPVVLASAVVLKNAVVSLHFSALGDLTQVLSADSLELAVLLFVHLCYATGHHGCRYCAAFLTLGLLLLCLISMKVLSSQLAVLQYLLPDRPRPSH